MSPDEVNALAQQLASQNPGTLVAIVSGGALGLGFRVNTESTNLSDSMLWQITLLRSISELQTEKLLQAMPGEAGATSRQLVKKLAHKFKTEPEVLRMTLGTAGADEPTLAGALAKIAARRQAGRERFETLYGRAAASSAPTPGHRWIDRMSRLSCLCLDLRDLSRNDDDSCYFGPGLEITIELIGKLVDEMEQEGLYGTEEDDDPAPAA